MGHFCAGIHGPTEWLRPSCSSAGALRPCCTGSRLSLRWGSQPQLRRRSKALLHEPPQVHARGVVGVASRQMHELIVPILKDWHSVGKKKKWARHSRGTLMLTKAIPV